MGTPVSAMGGDGTPALGSGSCMVEQDHAGEDGGKIQVPDPQGLGRPAASVASGRPTASVASSSSDGFNPVQSSQARKEKFEEIVIQAGITLNYRSAFAVLDTQDLSYMDNPTNPEWVLADMLCDIFKIFYDGTNALSGTFYPTAHLYFHVLWDVKMRLEKEICNKDSSIANMAVKMMEKFNKYWDLSLLQICIPVVLDPRYKFSFVAFHLNKGFGQKGPLQTQLVKTTMKNLFSAYSPTLLDENKSLSTQNSEAANEEDNYADWQQHLTQQKRKKAKSKLDVYYQDELFPRQKSFDVLQWWKMHSAKYPIISRMARDVFAAPASTVASEAAFSTTGRTVCEYRSRLTSKNIEAFICLQDWLRAEGYSNFKTTEVTGDMDAL